jgi:hypothetical protein
MNIAVRGDFWVPETPDVKVRGEFKAELGQQPEASLADGLVDDLAVTALPSRWGHFKLT